MEAYFYIPNKTVSEAIARLRSEGTYKPTGNSRMFIGPRGERVTFYNGNSPVERFTPGRTVSDVRKALRVVVKNSLDADMVEGDLKLTIGEAA